MAVYRASASGCRSPEFSTTDRYPAPRAESSSARTRACARPPRRGAAAPAPGGRPPRPGPGPAGGVLERAHQGLRQATPAQRRDDVDALDLGGPASPAGVPLGMAAPGPAAGRLPADLGDEEQPGRRHELGGGHRRAVGTAVAVDVRLLHAGDGAG